MSGPSTRGRRLRSRILGLRVEVEDLEIRP